MVRQFAPKRAMFIFSHPDDIEFVAGGTAALWAQNGSELIYVLVTDGSVGTHEEGITDEDLVTIRRGEQRAAARTIGAYQCEFLGYHDGLVEDTIELRKDLVRLIRLHRPDAVVTTDPTDLFPSDDYINHPDHRATALAALDAVYPMAADSHYFPNLIDGDYKTHCVDHLFVRNDSEANFFVDISPVMELRNEALLHHKSQFVGWDPVGMLQEWNAETGKLVGLPYAEAFRHIALCNRSPFPD